MSFDLSLLDIFFWGVVLLTAVLLLGRTRQQVKNPSHTPPRTAVAEMHRQVGQAVESGRHIHLSLGRGAIHETHAPATIAAQHALDHIGAATLASGSAPFVTVGDSTALMAAQESTAALYAHPDQPNEYDLTKVQFIADGHQPLAYAAGLSTFPHQPMGREKSSPISSQLLLGHLGSEVGLIAESGARQKLPQVIGSDDLLGLAVAHAYTGEVLMGEELLATEAQLHPHPTAVAGLQLQNLLRWFTILLILATSTIILLDNLFNLNLLAQLTALLAQLPFGK